jgi:Heterokaryon incompatibility protein (HET)
MSEPEPSGREAVEPRYRLNRAETSLGQHEGGRVTAARRRIVDAAHRVADSVEKKNTYAYKNISYDQEIRVLKIYPGKPGEIIKCRLVPCPLLGWDGQPCSDRSELIPYAALSYNWGESKPKNKVYIFDTDEAYEDCTSNKNIILPFVAKIHIQDNLRAALERLRSESDPVYLWADALCINQKNVRERTAQVAHMHEVYTQAEKVYIWLGEGIQEENQKAFNFLHKILDLEKLEELVERLARKGDEPTWKEDLQDCKRAIDLMKADWFSRRWVIQELALATNAHVCRGQCEIPWPEFADAIALFMTKYDRIRRAFEGPRTYSDSRKSDDHHIMALDANALGANTLVTATNNLFRRSNEGKIQQRLLSLELLVSSMLLAFEATDPKDTVFAVLQIAKDTSIDPSTEKVHSSIGVVGIFSRYIMPLVLVFLYKADITPLPSRADNSSTLDLSIRNTALSAGTGMFILVNYCILAFSMLLAWMIYAMLHDIVIKGCIYIMNGVRGDGSRVANTLDKRIEANYQKCLSDVCADFIEYCIESSKSLDILCRHWAPKPKQSPHVDMPSWILPVEGHAFGGPKQLSKARVNGDSFVGSPERKSHYTASGNLLPSTKFGKTKAVQEVVIEEIRQEPGDYTRLPPDEKRELPPRFDGTLEVKGFQLDVIEQTAPVIGPVISRAALELCGWSKEGGSSDIGQIWRILVANRGPDGANPPNWYRRACKACLEWYNDQPEDHFNTNNLKNMKGTPSGKVEFLDRVQQVVWNRQFVRTSGQTGREFIGLTPPKSQTHDIICILFGCSVPVVLRPIPNTKEFLFIGECYVHGAMDGEAVDPMPSGTRELWFKLR